MLLQDSFLDDEDTKILHPRRLRGKRLMLAWLVWFLGVTFYIGALGVFIPTQLSASYSGRLEQLEPKLNNDGSIFLKSNAPDDEIHTNEKLIAINGEYLKPNLTVYEVRRMWYGPIGSLVTLTLEKTDGSIYETERILSQNLKIVLDTLKLTPQQYDWYIFILDLLFILITSGVGFLLAWRKPYDWLALYASLTLILMAVNQSQLLQQAALGTQWHFILFGPPLALVHFSFYIFPDGKLSARWMIVPAMIIIAYYLGRMWVQWAEWAMPLDLVCYAIDISALIFRYRLTTSPIERQQIKMIWLGFSGGIIGVFLPILLNMVILAVFPTNFLFLPSSFWWAFILQPIHKVSVAIPAITLAIAMFRTGLWRVDYIITRSASYALVVIGLGGVFFAGVWGSSKMFELVSNGFTEPSWMIVIAAIFILPWFNPVRRKLQGWIDHRMYGIRIPYMAEQPQLPRLEFTQPIFSSYSGLTLVGSGGMSEVYRAWHESERQMVAIKILARNLPAHLDYRTRFLREASLLKSFEHPNIIHIFEYGEIDETPYMVMEYMDGGNLGEFLHQNGAFALQHALPILNQLASALDYIHARDILHRDIKPQNIMLKAGQPVLMDFGIAKRLHNTLSKTPADLLGTVNYMSPEQIQADPEIGAASDLYSFGVLAYQILTGQLPFRYGNAGAVLLAHINQPPPNPCEVNPHLPPMVGVAVQRMLAKQPAQRFATAGAFIEVLQQALINAPAAT